MDANFLSNVYGYSQIKEELFIIQQWYFNNEKLGNKLNLLPKGILFYGPPGEGKTHLMREFSNSFNYKIFVIEGNEDNLQEEIVSAYQKAREEKNSIVIIDELDKLIEKDTKLTRILQAQLDGFNNTDNILTLATANDYDSIPEAILRDGRFDRKFKVSTYNKEDFRLLIDGFARDADLHFNETEIEELVDELYRYSVSTVRSIMNNASLRFGSNCSVKEIMNTADFLNTGFIKKDNSFKVSKELAIHEAGHAIYIYKCCDSQKFLRIYFNENGGCTVYNEPDEYETTNSRLEVIRGALAGLVAEDLIIGNHGVGCGSDLEKAYDFSFRLMNRTCIKGIHTYCTVDGYFDRSKISEHSNKIYDKKAMRFFAKQYKVVKKELKKYKIEIKKIADYLMSNKEMRREEFIKLVN